MWKCDRTNVAYDGYVEMIDLSKVTNPGTLEK